MFEGPMEHRLSFSELARDLHKHLCTCDAHDKAEWAPGTEADATACDYGGGATSSSEGGRVAVGNAILSRLCGKNAEVNWRSS